MPAPIDLTGKKFGRLTVVGKKYVPKNGRNRIYWECECECGGKVDARVDSLTTGLVRSCGCLKKEQDRINLTANHSHKMSGKRLYRIWVGMKGRCHNPRNPSYGRYGARGIVVCEEWKNSFEAFQMWAFNNGYSDDKTIERIDNNGPYSPENCRWATNKEQSRNRRSNIKVLYQGKHITLMELSEATGIPYGTIAGRYERGDRGKRLVRSIGEDYLRVRGSRQHLSKLTENDVISIKRLLQLGEKQKEIARKYGISPATVNSIAKGRTWKHV